MSKQDVATNVATHFDRMTKGEWRTFGDSITEGIGDSQNFICRFPKGCSANWESNAKAIVSLHNNVTAKGINPESVEKMKVYCELQEKWDEEGQFEYEGKTYTDAGFNDDEGLDILSKLRKEALTSSKL
jgi:hypothetical protein